MARAPAGNARAAHRPPKTVRLTTAQALVRWMIAQRSELLDGSEVPLFAGVFGIFGHGNVLGLGTALFEVRDRLPTWRGNTEEGMALAAVGFGKAMDRRQVMVATSSIGPGALNMVTAAGVAHANRIPVLLLPGDTFQGRAPDPVLQQVEPFGDPTITVNDAFRPVSRYFDRITRPEQLIATLPQVARVLTDPADAGPVVVALPQDVQTETFDVSGGDVRAETPPRLPAATGRGRSRRSGRDPPVCASAIGHHRRRRPLLGCRPGRPGLRRTAWDPAGGYPGRPDARAARAPALRRAAGHRRVAIGKPTRLGGRRGAGHRHAPPGLHHLVVDGVRRGRPSRVDQCRAIRRDQARGARRRGRRPRDRRGAGAAARGMVGRRGVVRERGGRAFGVGRLRGRAACGTRSPRGTDVRPGRRCDQRR